MALKGPREIDFTDISLAAQSAQLRGVCMVQTVGGSGVAQGDSAGFCDVASNPSGLQPAGILLEDVVSIDQTRYHRNFHKLEQVVGERVALLTKGRITTDQISGTPTAKATAYLTTNGQLTPTQSATGGLVATPKVGRFAGSKDENGFVAVDINIPVA